MGGRLRTGLFVAFVALAAFLAFDLGALLHLWSSPATSTLQTESLDLPSAAAQALAVEGMTPVSGLRLPRFTLVDQYGRTVRTSDFRGRAVVLTFLDPVCWDECTFQALDLRLMRRYLPAALRPRVALVAIAANPVVHSVAAVAAFSRETGLGRDPDWYFLTSPSLATLERVWHRFDVSVPTPPYLMADHPLLFVLADPSGRLRYESVPEDTAASFVGTAELLAAYTADLLGARADLRAPTPGLSLLTSTPFAPALPHTRDVLDVSLAGSTGTRLVWRPSLGEYVLETTSDGGAEWRRSELTGVDAHGGILAAAGGGGRVVAVVLPYGYDLTPTVFVSRDGGRRFAFAGVLPKGSLPVLAAQRAILGDAAASRLVVAGDAAYLLGADAVWRLPLDGGPPIAEGRLPSALGPPRALLGQGAHLAVVGRRGEAVAEGGRWVLLGDPRPSP